MLSCYEISRDVHKSVALNLLGDALQIDNTAHVLFITSQKEVNETKLIVWQSEVKETSGGIWYWGANQNV